MNNLATIISPRYGAGSNEGQPKKHFGSYLGKKLTVQGTPLSPNI